MTDAEFSCEVRKTWSHYFLRKSRALRKSGFTHLSAALRLESFRLRNVRSTTADPKPEAYAVRIGGIGRN